MGYVRIQSFIFLLYLSLVEPRWRSLFKPKEREPVKIIPNDLDRSQLSRLRLPNKVFCAEMERQTAGIYTLLPWWYPYCQALKEKRAKNLKIVNNFYKPLYKSVLEHLRVLRRQGVTSPPRTNRKLFLKRL